MEEHSPDSTNSHPQGEHPDPRLLESQLPHQLPSPEGSRHPTLFDSQLPQQLPSAERTAPSIHVEQSGPSSNQRTHLMLPDGQLMQPLQTHMLPFLSLQSMAALRASCRTLQQLVDTAAEAWLESASRWLPHKCLEHAADSLTVQNMLRTQHRTMHGLRRSRTLSSDRLNPACLSSDPVSSEGAVIDKTVVHEIQHEYWQRAADVQWAPAWPSPYIAILLQRDADLVPCDLGDKVLPDDVPAAILLETDAWGPLEGLQDEWTRATWQHGVWWPASSGNATDKHTFAFISHFLQVAQIDPEKSKIQLISDLGWEWTPQVLAPDGKAVKCRNSKGSVDMTAIIDLESLQERFCVSPAALAPTTRHSQAEMMTLSPAWIDWSPPAGNVLAVAWHTSNKPFYLTFHDASSGTVLKQIDLQAHVSVKSKGRRRGTYSWSPSGKHVAMVLDAPIAGVEGGVLGFGSNTSNYDGWSHVLQSHDFGIIGEVHWSPCGRYLHVEQSGGVNEQHFTSSYIWDTLRGESVFDWTDGRAGLVIWSDSSDNERASLRSVCLVASCHMLLVLPVGGCFQRPVQILYDAPRNYRFADWDISPCGTLLVGTWQVAAPPAPFEFDDDELLGPVADFRKLRQIRLPHHLWHAEILVDAHDCCNREAASSLKAWCMDSIAWHPSPISRRMYAIAREDGAVYLMDGRGHKCLRVWSAEQLHMPPGEPDVRLTWSPDGSQLAVAAWGRTTFLSLSS